MQNLACSVCGVRCSGRQWHNRDLGHGLCPLCAIWLQCERGMSIEEMESLYGMPGYHYQTPLHFLPTPLQVQARRVVMLSENMTDELYDALFDSELATDMPHGTAKARTGDPYEWLTNRLAEVLQQ